MNIGEILEISSKYIPERSSCMTFSTIGCNLNCEFCNRMHLLDRTGGKQYRVEDLINIVKNNYLVKCIYIQGGEPTIQGDILQFCKRLNNLDKFIGIETNGLKPYKIKQILPYIDRVVLNLMAPLEKGRFSEITKKNVDINNFFESFFILNDNKEITFNLRITYIKSILKPEDIHYILKLLRKQTFTGNFILKQYEYFKGASEDFKQKFKKPEHIDLINILKPYVDKELPFNIYLEDDIYEHSEIHKIFQKILT